MILRIQCPRCQQLFDAELTEQQTQTSCTHCQEEFFAANVLSQEQFDMLLAETEGRSGSPGSARFTTPIRPISPAVGSPVMAPAITPTSGGETFGNYRLEEKFFQNDFWITYRATDLHHHRMVILRVFVAGVPEAEMEVVRIGERLGRIQQILHPGINQIYDVDLEGGDYYCASEFVAGEPAIAVAGRGALSLDQTTAIVLMLGDALNAVHEEGVIHGGIHPHSVLLDAQVQPKLVDLGLSYSPLPFEKGKPQTGQPHYCAPERLAGVPITAQTDVYGIGCLLFHLLCGRAPFLSPSPVELLKKIERSRPPDVTAINPQLPPGLGAICAKCLEKEPADRYPTIQALMEDIERVRLDEQVLAKPVPSMRRAVRTVRRSVLSTVLGVLILVSLGLGGLYAFKAYLDPARTAKAQLIEGLTSLEKASQSETPDYDKVIETLTAANKSETLTPKLQLSALLGLGRAHEATAGNEIEAEEAYDAAVELAAKAKSELPYLWRARMYYRQQRYEEAIVDLKFLKKTRSARDYFLHGMAYFKAAENKPENAQTAYLNKAKRQFVSAGSVKSRPPNPDAAELVKMIETVEEWLSSKQASN